MHPLSVEMSNITIRCKPELCPCTCALRLSMVSHSFRMQRSPPFHLLSRASLFNDDSINSSQICNCTPMLPLQLCCVNTTGSFIARMRAVLISTFHPQFLFSSKQSLPLSAPLLERIPPVRCKVHWPQSRPLIRETFEQMQRTQTLQRHSETESPSPLQTD